MAVAAGAWLWRRAAWLWRRAVRNTVPGLAQPGLAYRRAKLVSSPLRYFVNEVLQRPGAQRYRLGASGDTIRIRHDFVDDPFVLEEIFGPENVYGIPPRVVEHLAATGVSKFVDLGGNIGMATLKFAREFPAAAVTVVEPDPDNASVLEATLADNSLLDRTTVIRAAAATADGAVSFVGGQAGRSHIAKDESEVFAVPAIDIFPTLEGAELLKMDIEGAEWPILADQRLRTTSLAAACLEYHEYKGHSGPSAPELLESAGFAIVTLREEARSAEVSRGVIWCIRGR